jgi:hypothetical protein
MPRIESAHPYRVQGSAVSIAELAQKKPGFIIPATDAQIAELAQHGEQMQAREAAAARHAAGNPDPVYAQIVANGKVLATVYASGSASTQQNLNLRLTEDGAGLALAQTRLAELSKAIQGEVVYAKGPLQAPAPLRDADLPQVTARGLNEMVRDMDWALARSRMAGAADSKG